MNFTWFASAYDTDDIRYRLLTFVQIAGVLEPDTRSVFGWGYAHYFLFASPAGLGAGLEVALAYFEAHEHMSARTAGFVVAAGRSGRWPSRTGSVVPGPSGRMRQWRRHESPYPESRSRVRLR